ncbi:hypothetical protein BJ165DRAFT_1407851 [Panaeolus papilionaceus]|nr:hypothetical protein BJ165DRAFT_1407851 [Panaeolus papilionaceus]
MQEQIEEIEDACEQDVHSLHNGKHTFFECAVRNRIKDKYWQACYLRLPRPQHPNPFIEQSFTQALGDNDSGVGEPADGDGHAVVLTEQKGPGGREYSNNSPGGREGASDTGDIPPGDDTGVPAGDDWMSDSERDPNEQGDVDKPITPHHPQAVLQSFYSMSAPHVKREALPLNTAEKGLIKQKRVGDELAAISQFRVMHASLKRAEWLDSACNALEEAFLLGDLGGTYVKSANTLCSKKCKLE